MSHLDEIVFCKACGIRMISDNRDQLHAKCKKQTCVKCNKPFKWTKEKKRLCGNCNRDQRISQRLHGGLSADSGWIY